MPNREQVLRTLGDHAGDLRRLGVRRLGLFGSVARGEATEASDLDLVVELEHKSFDSYMDVKLYLEDLFGCRIDLVLSDAIKPRLRPLILNETLYAPGLPSLS